MKTRTIGLLLLLVPFLLRASSQNIIKAPAVSDNPKNGFRAEFITDLNDMQKKCIGLANAVPADRYGWRPGAGVRSISEVYTHMAGGTYYLATFLGEQPPVHMPKDIETITDKPTVVAELRKSFDYIRGLMKRTPDADLDKPVTVLGSQTTVRGVYVMILNHLHEHLGQSVAYARMNKVVPPWSR
jgi:DinB superfamily